MSRIPDRVTPGCPAWCEETATHATHVSSPAWVDDVAVSIFEYREESRIQVLDLNSDDSSVHLSPSDARDLGRVLGALVPGLAQALIAAADLAEGA